MLLRHYNKNSSWGPQCSAAEKNRLSWAPQRLCLWTVFTLVNYCWKRSLVLLCTGGYSPMPVRVLRYFAVPEISFRLRFFPHGYHSPLPLAHSWSWEAHLLEDGRTISMARSLLNSALVATNFSGGKTSRSGKDRTTVTMWWETPCLTGVSLVQGLINDGKPSRSRVKGSPTDGGIKRKSRWGLGHSEDSAWIRAP